MIIFILTNEEEQSVQDTFNLEKYKFFDSLELKQEFKDKYPDIELKYEGILINQHIMKRIRNGLKSFRNKYFFYKVTELDKRIVENVKEYVLTNHGHKVSHFNAFVDGDFKMDKDVEELFDIVYTTDYSF